ncbi:hypothetical protein Hanom_Chr04g00327051 [Helianthus anomalus]
MLTNHHKNIKELEKLLIRYHFSKFLFNSSDTGKNNSALGHERPNQSTKHHRIQRSLLWEVGFAGW